MTMDLSGLWMDLSANLPMLALLFLVVVVSYWLLDARLSWRNMPPGPPSLPVIGSLPFLGTDMNRVYSKMAAKYGPVFSLGLGSQKVVVLNGFDAIKEGLLKSRACDGRSDAFEFMDDGKGVISTQGEPWKAQRRFIMQSLRDFGVGKHTMEIFILEEARLLANELRATGGTPYNMADIVAKSVANIVAAFLFGQRFEYEDPILVRYLKDTHEGAQILAADNPAVFFKFLRKLPGDIFRIKELKSIADNWMRVFRGMIEDRKASIAANEPREDFITHYLNQIPTWKHIGDTQYFEKHLEHVIDDMFVAGVETTSNTLLWTILHLVKNPQIQQKVIEELDAVVGDGRPPSMADRSSLPYTEAVISEIQRICDLVPQSLPHMTISDLEINGYKIPTGTMIIPNLYSVHHDPKLYPDPETFDPQRFLDDSGKFIKREELIPFSLGRRSCLGESLAKSELFLFLTYMLQNFRFSPSPSHPQLSTRGLNGIVHEPEPYHVIITAR